MYTKLAYFNIPTADQLHNERNVKHVQKAKAILMTTTRSESECLRGEHLRRLDQDSHLRAHTPLPSAPCQSPPSRPVPGNLGVHSEDKHRGDAILSREGGVRFVEDHFYIEEV